MSPDHLRKIAELHAALGQAYREAAGDPPSNAAPMPKPKQRRMSKVKPPEVEPSPERMADVARMCRLMIPGGE